MPFLGHRDGNVAAALSALPEGERGEFVYFLLRNGLASFWNTRLRDKQFAAPFTKDERRTIKQAALSNAASYLMQKYVLDLITSIFSSESITHAVFKGAHIREIIYDDPNIRPAADIDVLIYPDDLEKTVTAFTGAGFALNIKEQNISHELTLTYKNVSIDLHWHILRPGRLRNSLTDEFLATRQLYPTHTGFNAETTLFIMLVHPVFTKYSTTCLASLVRMIDLVEWIRTQAINWDALAELLKRYRVCTAAWLTARYLEILTDETLPDPFLRRIRPQRLKRAYLNNWLQTNRASSLLKHPLAIQAGFTLPAHDSFSDAARFLKILFQERYAAQQKSEDLRSAVSPNR